MLKSVIFDLDDTLIDWAGVDDAWDALELRNLGSVFDYLCEIYTLESAEAYQLAYRDHINQASTRAGSDLSAPNVGVSMVKAAAALGVPEASIDLTRLLKACDWQQIPGTRLFPEVPETLHQLRSAGLRFGLVTNAEIPMLMRDRELEALELTEYFPECRFSAADHGYLKPHPSIFQAALDCLGSTPEESVFVGDEFDADIVGAKQAGLFAIWRTRQLPAFPAHEAHSDVQPDAIITSLAELPGIFDSAFPGWRKQNDA